jgi:RNA polymerase I-specific transcription initiation factor RRN7
MSMEVSTSEGVEWKTDVILGEDNLLGKYFALPKGTRDDEDVRAQCDERHVGGIFVEATEELRPGEGYRMYNCRDRFGILPSDYSIMIERGARWVGVSVEILNGVVETYERRLDRWWKRQPR